MIIFGNATAVGRHSIALGDENDATPFEEEEIIVEGEFICVKSLTMEGYDDLDVEDMIENEMDEELNEILKCLLISIQAILHALYELMQSLCHEHVAHPLTR
ncbi:hypothetical protein Sjap_013276 [Stephania japonica]|uniref:Uncharacterized protein n=1 Tax=Stephania japonica TaxID=461633 RepID=A0AAP0IXP9_9MAGN